MLDNFAKRFSHALDLNSIPRKGKGRQRIVAEMFGVSQKGASKWLEGSSLPTIERLQEISLQLKVHLEWLLIGSGPVEPGSSIAGAEVVKKIPLIAWEGVASWVSKTNKEREGLALNFVMSDLNSGPDTYALKVQEEDDSMAPRYCPGDVIIVDPDIPPVHKSIIIIQWKESKAMAFAQYLENGPEKYISQNNKTYDPVKFTADNEPYIYYGRARQVIIKTL
jgi:phage repressor protein C with HTH and peptisase S24 domain